MKTDPMFHLPEDRPSARRDRHLKAEALKQKHGIFTHLCRGGGDWMAFSLPECVKKLEGYSLTETEKTDGMELFARYCRLLDEAGLIADGYRTEFEACEAIAKRLEAK